MRIETNTPDLLVLRFVRWKASLIFTILTLLSLWIGARIISLPDGTIGWLLLWLFLTTLWTTLFALLFAEKSMLVLNAETNEAALSHRTIAGLHQHRWPLSEVQSTRVTRHHAASGPAINDPKRIITLYVRDGMDEGRHKLHAHTIKADDALAASAAVSDWMRDWRRRVDSSAPKP